MINLAPGTNFDGLEVWHVPSAQHAGDDGVHPSSLQTHSPEFCAKTSHSMQPLMVSTTYAPPQSAVVLPPSPYGSLSTKTTDKEGGVGI
jgi:hypothetical protein